MAYRPRGYGLSAETKQKQLASYSTDIEQKSRLWIEAILGEELEPGADPNEPLGRDRFYKVLKNGQILCRLINAIQPGSVKKINTKDDPFSMMENIGNFLDACSKYGLTSMDLFLTPALYDKDNMTQVVNTIYALGRKAQKQGFTGPKLGVKESEHNPRNFSEEKLREGHTVIGLQMGSAKGANQQGINFGKSRSIID